MKVYSQDFNTNKAFKVEEEGCHLLQLMKSLLKQGPISSTQPCRIDQTPSIFAIFIDVETEAQRI